MEGGSVYQIRSKREEHVFRVLFFLVFLEGNLKRANRGWKGLCKDHIVLGLEKKILLLLKNVFSR